MEKELIRFNEAIQAKDAIVLEVARKSNNLKEALENLNDINEMYEHDLCTILDYYDGDIEKASDMIIDDLKSIYTIDSEKAKVLEYFIVSYEVTERIDISLNIGLTFKSYQEVLNWWEHLSQSDKDLMQNPTIGYYVDIKLYENEDDQEPSAINNIDYRIYYNQLK